MASSGGDQPFEDGPDGLRLSVAGRTGRWVDLRIADDPLTGSAGLSLAFLGADGRPGPLLAEEALGGGAYAWTGRVPADAVSLRIATRLGRRPEGLRSARLHPLPRPLLLLRALRRDPGLALAALGWRLRGKKVRARGFLERALAGAGRPATRPSSAPIAGPSPRRRPSPRPSPAGGTRPSSRC